MTTPPQSKTIPVIVNAGARSGQDLDAAEVRRVFATHGVDVEVHCIEKGADLQDAVEQLLAAGATCVIAAGGDGTINAVASRVVEHPTAVLGVIPVGTLNHFARDMGIPDELDAAAALIAQGIVREVDVGDVNGRVFLNNSSIGLYASMVVHREQLQKRLHIGKWRALAKASWKVLRQPSAFSVTLHVDGEDLHRRTPFVFVGNNDYTVQGPRMGARETLDDGHLSAFVLRPYGPWGLVGLMLRALVGRMSEEKDLDAISATSLVVESSRGRVHVARDGEVDLMDTPVCFRVRPRALRVYAPAPEASP